MQNPFGMKKVMTKVMVTGFSDGVRYLVPSLSVSAQNKGADLPAEMKGRRT